MMAAFDSWGTSFGSPSAWGVAWLHSGAQPTPGRSGLGGDDVPRRRSPYRGWDRKAWRAAQDDLDAVEATLRGTYAELTGADAPVSVLAQVDAIVRPAARQEARDVPLEIDWAKMARDFEAANRLMALARAEADLRAAIDDDEDLLMMLT